MPRRRFDPLRPTGNPKYEEQLAFVIRCRLACLTVRQIVAAAKQHHGIGQHRTRHLLDEGLRRLRDQHDREKPYSRALQAARIEDMIRALLAQKPTSARASAIVRCEALLADIQGNRSPLQIDLNVSVTSALAGVLGNMPPDRLEELRNRARDARDKAAAVPRLEARIVALQDRIRELEAQLAGAPPLAN